MIPNKLYQVLKHEGVVAMATQGDGEAHLVNTWNSYLTVTSNERILYPAGGMRVTESNLLKDKRVNLTVGCREVEGLHGQGAGFLIKGTASFLTSGADYDAIKQRFSWARAAVEIKIDSVTQTL